jgi:hypothetical protein
MSVNGQDITAKNSTAIIQGLFKTSKTNDLLTVVVKRVNESGAEELVTLTAPMMKLPVKQFNVLSLMPNPSEEQQKLLNYWLTPSKEVK